ncbi:unnamed protein product [Auanema sp. JU1783]|nr:unnamed protein product [Auanema sp. JU1783]
MRYTKHEITAPGDSYLNDPYGLRRFATERTYKPSPLPYTRMVDLADLQAKKANLKKTSTNVLLEDGSVVIEERTSDGNFVRRNGGTSRRAGFVIDLNPDLQIAECCEGLFLGSQDAARELEQLKKLKITHVLNVATGIPNFFPNEFTYKLIEAFDLPSMRLIDYFDEAAEYIQRAINAGGKVFVHCNAGISRSSTLVLAYMMKVRGFKLEAALEAVRKNRKIAKPNPGFMQQLLTYEDQISCSKPTNN